MIIVYLLINILNINIHLEEPIDCPMKPLDSAEHTLGIAVLRNTYNYINNNKKNKNSLKLIY
jgi:hypothetical protein